MRHLVMPVLAASAMVLSTAPAYADLGDQLFKLLADDGAADDEFGRSVAISGTTAIVGVRDDDDNGINSGSAYLFDINTGRQLFKLLADDGVQGDQFGYSVAISGTTAIVGAKHNDDDWSGSAYLFDINTGQQLFKLVANDGAPLDRFGTSLAISGTTAIVGADSDDDYGINSGSAYLFDTTTGRQIAKLLPNDGAAYDYFGRSVAISGSTAIVGVFWDDDNGARSGSAYLFDTTTGQQIAKLLADDGTADDLFGLSVAISDAIAVVGAPGDQENGDDSGSVYLFHIADPANPIQSAKLVPDDGAAGDLFGRVAISGQTAIVGVKRDDDNGTDSGSAYLFDIITGQQIAKLLPKDGAEFDRFGSSVAINRSTAIVGAYFDDDNGKRSGSAYLFDAAAPGGCPPDFDNSGDVGVKDLLFLLGAWGPCPPKGDCLADFDGDNVVGVKDLLILLANWGPCP